MKGNLGVPELDTSLYSKYIVNEVDTHLYPVHQWVTSQRYPLDKYGISNVFDQDQSTWWCSQAGLNCGEGFEFIFDSLPATKMKVWIADDFTVAKVNRIKIYVNDSLYGFFPSGTEIIFKDNVRKIRIIAADADGLNEVKLPVINDSNSSRKTAYEILSTRYNSRSFGIAEVEFYDNKNRRLPVNAIPWKEAEVNCAYITWPPDRYFLFDGNINTGGIWFQAAGMGKMIVNFKDFTPITQLRISSYPNHYEKHPCVTEMGILINGKEEQKFKLNCGENIIKLKDPLVARVFTFSFHQFQNNANAASVNELYAFDGARWYTIIPDSSQERIQPLIDTLSNTPFHYLLDHQVYYSTKINELTSDTFKLPNYEVVNQNYLKRIETYQYESIFRSNRSLEFKYSKKIDNFLPKAQSLVYEYSIRGYWRILERNTNFVKLEIRGYQYLQHFKDNQLVDKSNIPISYLAIIENEYLSVGSEFGKMRISY